MGALLSSSILRDPATSGSQTEGSSWFDVDRFRSVTTRRITIRRCTRSLLVLGSTQSRDAVDEDALRSADVLLARRRTGGTSVLLAPDDPLWVDVWLPRGDPLWVDDVVRAPVWVGEWWAAALDSLGIKGLKVHKGRPVPGRFSHMVCFAGIGPGEVISDGRKIVGVAQWRARQGALTHTAAYKVWDSARLLSLLSIDGAERNAAVRDVDRSVIGIDEALGRSAPDRAVLTELERQLPADRPWEIVEEELPS